LAKSLPLASRKLQSDPGRGFADNPVVERIIALIDQRCALTIRRLTDPAADGETATEQSS
jgi:serine/threonine-protein kinase HipA